MAYSAVPLVATSDSWTASQHNTYLRDNMAYFKTTLDAIGQALFPVGSIIYTSVSTNPSTYLGGTWSAYGSGRVAVAIDAGQTEFDTAGETGGSKTHSLTSSENGAHTHNVATLPTSYDYSQVAGSGYFAAAVVGTVTTASSGSGTAHNNLQPYIVVYRWRRTA